MTTALRNPSPAREGVQKEAPMEIADALTQIREIQTIRQRHAAAIIAAGLFSDSEQWTDVAATLGEPEAKPTSEALAALLGAGRVSNPNDPSHTIAKSDLLCQLYTPYLEAGFLVGVAVGMQLGPHVFDGVETMKGRAR